MKKITTFLFSLWMYFSLATPAMAACTVNGEDVPCDQFFNQYGPLFIGIMVLCVLVAIVASGFWIWMLIDCIKRDFSDKTMWILLLVFTGGLGAILYYFLVKNKKA